MKKYHEEHIKVERPHLNIGSALQRIYKFPNNYGASIVWGYNGSLFTEYDAEAPYELAVIRFIDDDDYYLDYSTGLTTDVFRHQNEEQIRDLLKQIKNLDEVAYGIE